jgi:hypothetical protein
VFRERLEHFRLALRYPSRVVPHLPILADPRWIRGEWVAVP